MRLADYVIRFLEERGIDHAFTVCGGGAIFICDALARAERMKYIACHKEQGAAMAAEGYARMRTAPGLAVVTSGPGGLNAITGVAGAWTDCVPTITISGQVFSSQTVHGHPGLRTMGVQEIDVVPMVQHITKYAVQVREPATIREHLEKALYLAQSGRPGPVWLDLPADVQNAQIEPKRLAPWVPGISFIARPALDEAVAQVGAMVATAERPLLHIGQGVRLAGAQEALFDLLSKARIPVVTARNGNDLISSDHELYVGRPGTFAQRGANFAVQTSDLHIAVGTRLCLAQTGYNAKDYARRAKVVQVDVDQPELDKGTCRVDLKVQADAKEFLEALVRQLQLVRPGLQEWAPWLERCKGWMEKYPPVTDAQRKQARYVNSYHLVDELSNQLTPQDVVVTDMGFAFQNTHQAFRVKTGQRLFTNGGLAAMGWGLPAAIGAAVGSGRRVVCIAGDGGFDMNSPELSTAQHHGLPIKIFLLNNGGYLTMRQSQAHAFDGRYMGSDEGSGLSMPDFELLAKSHHVWHVPLQHSRDVEKMVRNTLAITGTVMCEVAMDPDQAQVPKSVNRRDEAGNIKQTPIEDAHPYLDRDELEENLRV